MAQKKKNYKKPEPLKTVAKNQKNTSNNRKKINYGNGLIIITILIVTYISFSPSLKNGFTNWDDNAYVTENNTITHLKSENIKTIFFDFVNFNYYHPLTMLSLAIDYNSAKLSPERYHLVNLFFHILNTLLVFIFIYRLSGKRTMVAALVAIVFGIHPMHVESVAWISERKDVLYTFFFIGGLITYLTYLRKGSRSILFYLFTLILFLFSSLSKPSAVTFPLVLLLIDYFVKRKFDLRCILEKVPFLIISVILGILTIKDQSTTAAITKWGVIAIHNRIFFASYGFITYIFKFLFPFNLSAFYPYPTKFPITEALPIIFYAAPFIALGLFFLVYKSIKISRLYAFGFLFFFINIVLILQFLSVGPALMADRYTYIPYIGLAFIAGMELDRFYKNKKPLFKVLKYIVTISLIIVGIVFSVLTFQRAKVWKNSGTLWTDVINKFPGKVDVSYKNRGNYYARELKLYDNALMDYNSYIAIDPWDATIYSNRGNLYGLMKKFDLSLADYSKSISLDSTNLDAFLNRGVTYMAMKKFDLALADINKAIKHNPKEINGYRNRAFCYVNIGKNEEAIKEYNDILASEPDDFNNYFYRGIAYYNSKKYKEALDDFSKTIQLNPGYSEAFKNRSQTYNMLGDYRDALNDALKAEQMGQPLNKEYINILKTKIK